MDNELERHEVDDTNEEERTGDGSEWKPLEVRGAQWAFAGVIVAYAVAALAYRMLVSNGLGRSGLMFIGLPTLLAALLALTPPARSSTGAIMKFITLSLLLVAPLVGEGYLCILIASPLFYGVGGIVALIVNWGKDGKSTRASCVAVLMLPFCMEGTVPMMSFPREQNVAVRQVVDASPAEVEAALALPPRIDRRMPLLLRIGFPRPLAVWGGGRQVGSERGIHFSGAETAPPGDMVLRVTGSSPQGMDFAVVRDNTKLREWMQWQGTHVTWRAVDATHTEVTWSAQFRRDLDPAWYFGPWERLVVEQALAYLIQSNATPGGRG